MERGSFASPPNEYRVTPFWGWNDALTDDELRRQIAEMEAGGWGGFFPHPRDGMVTPYLTDEYAERLRTAVHEAASRGMKVWIYDEHPFPSGTGGGLVPARGPQHRMKALVCKPYNRLLPMPEVVAYFAARTSERGIEAVEPIADPEGTTAAADLFLHFYEWVAPPGDDFARGMAYIDALDPATVELFLATTYEAVRRAVGEHFGGTVPGFFSDMASYQVHLFAGAPRPSVPWTPALREEFRARKGYDLVPHLPSLFFDVGEYRRVRIDFWDTVTERFVETFMRRIAGWCDEHGVQFSGHLWGEEHLHWQMHWAGPTMRSLAEMHVPGIDHLNREPLDPLGPKHADSVACQLGKPRVMAESYAMSGYGLTFEERKRVGDWEYALGANMLVPYLAMYSLRGARKRDEPPAMGYQQPWWPHNRMLDDYFARLSYALTRGHRVVDVLLLEPIASAWALYRPTGVQPRGMHAPGDPFEAAGYPLFAFNRAFTEVVEGLLRRRRDYHLGDEKLLERHATVDGATLRVGQGAYRAVVVPPSATWSRTTVDLLGRFVRAGGLVVAVDPAPTMVDGRPSADALPSGVHRVAQDVDALVTLLDDLAPRDVVVEAQDGVLHHRRRAGDDELHFLANSTPDRSAEVTLRLPGAWRIEDWDAISGAVTALPVNYEDAATCVELTLPSAGARLLVASPGRGPVGRPARPEVAREVALSAGWRVSRRDPNALVVDYCRYRFEDGPWSERVPLWRAEDAVRGAGFGVPFALRYAFTVEHPPPGGVRMVVENRDRFDVRVNGAELPREDVGFFWDRSLRVYEAAGLVTAGENVVDVSGAIVPDRELGAWNLYVAETFRYPAPFGSLYVLGDFAVRREDHAIVAEPPETPPGDLTRLGYPFYAGSMTLSQEVELHPIPDGTCYLETDGLTANVAEVAVNGEAAGRLAWPPHRVAVTELLRAGTNTFDLTLTNTLNNLLGPHHLPWGEARAGVHHHLFRGAVGWRDEHALAPFGLAGARLVWETRSPTHE